MNKKELKNLLKPLIKDCIKEVIFEEGILSNIVSEVAHGLGKPTLVEASRPTSPDADVLERRMLEEQQAVQKRKQELLSTINADAYGGVNVFEGTTPLSTGGSIEKGPSAQGPLAEVDPTDPGVDISSLVGLAGNRWSAHLK